MSEANHSLKRASYLSLILSLRNIHIAYNKCRNMACILFACMCYVLLLGLNLNLYILSSCRLHSGQCKDQLAMHVCMCCFFFIYISDKEQLLLSIYQILPSTYLCASGSSAMYRKVKQKRWR